MTPVLWIFGSVIALCTFGPIMMPHGRYTPQHDSTRALAAHALTTPAAPSINYAGNPYRVGAYVYVQELAAPGADDWTGTYLGMADGMALVRDQASLVVTHVNKDQLYSAQR